jgi:hypothetical protein
MRETRDQAIERMARLVQQDAETDKVAGNRGRIAKESGVELTSVLSVVDSIFIRIAGHASVNPGIYREDLEMVVDEAFAENSLEKTEELKRELMAFFVYID